MWAEPTFAIEQEVRELHRAHAAELQRQAAVMMRNPAGAPDAVQEAFLRYFVERRYGRVIENPRAWLYRVLRNYVLDCFKTAEAQRDIVAGKVERLPDPHSDPETVLGDGETAREIFAQLSPRERECLQLRAEGLKYEDIAAAMGLKCGTVGVLLTRAFQKIRRAAESGRDRSLRTAHSLRLLLVQGALWICILTWKP